MKPLAILFSIALFASCEKNTKDTTDRTELEVRKERIKEMDNSLSFEAIDRRAQSVTILENRGVPYIDHLPVIEDSMTAKRRSKEVIAHRAIALAIVSVKGEGLEQETISSLVEKYEATPFLSEQEIDFVSNKNPDEHSRIQFVWRYECLWVMLWALGYVDELEYPDSICDVEKAESIIADRNTDQLIADSQLRDLSEILDQADLIYRYHWAVVSARLEGNPPPASLDKGVVMERHYALNWLIGYMDQEWDDISTDT
ncbi:MAG: DUF4272 domain-containing protein [Luteolibacter sp.]